MTNDWLNDGRLDGKYSCATTREAIRQLDHQRLVAAAVTFHRYAKSVCR